jgi:ParB family chromosome partitioning protein
MAKREKEKVDNRYEGCYGSLVKSSEVITWLENLCQDNMRHQELGLPRWTGNIWGVAGSGKTAIVKDFNDQQMMEIAILENIQRENLSPIEEAQAYKNFMKKMNMTQEEIAKRFGKSRSHITNLLGLLNLPKDVQTDVTKGKISMSHARVLSKLEDKEQILELANNVKEYGISVRELENISREEDVVKRKPIIKTKTPSSTRNKVYENALKEVVGSKVSISSNKITISYNSEADLDRIMEILNVEIGE